MSLGKRPMAAVWRDSFATFAADVGPRPSLAHKLFLRRRELGVVPGNVVWRLLIKLETNKKADGLFPLRRRKRSDA